jgi:hypothetical protein
MASRAEGRLCKLTLPSDIASSILPSQPRKSSLPIAVQPALRLPHPRQQLDVPQDEPTPGRLLARLFSFCPCGSSAGPEALPRPSVSSQSCALSGTEMRTLGAAACSDAAARPRRWSAILGRRGCAAARPPLPKSGRADYRMCAACLPVNLRRWSKG